MKKRVKQIIAVAIMIVTLASTIVPAYAANFGSRFDGEGIWSDTNNLIWTFTDGSGSITIGRGPVFSDIHPEINDPEYYLKEAVLYTGEATTTLNSAGQPKSNYTEGTLPLLQEFVNSFDWINSDEVTRLQKVHDRIANGKNGNEDQHSGKTIPAVSFSVLQYKIGNCSNYAVEFKQLANYVGLECEAYSAGPMHAACLVKINGQWITVDPFVKTSLLNGNYTIPVDYEIEYHRYANEVKNSEWYQEQMQRAEWWRQVEAGEMTEVEYYKKIYPEMSETEIQEKFLSWNGYVDGLGNN